MAISSISEIGSKPPAMPAAPAVAASPGAAPVTEEAQVTATRPVAEPAPAAEPAPPPPPPEGFPFDVLVREHAGSGRKVYDFLDQDTGREVVQIPVEAVLNLVAEVIRQLEADGRR